MHSFTERNSLILLWFGHDLHLTWGLLTKTSQEDRRRCLWDSQWLQKQHYGSLFNHYIAQCQLIDTGEKIKVHPDVLVKGKLNTILWDLDIKITEIHKAEDSFWFRQLISWLKGGQWVHESPWQIVKINLNCPESLKKVESKPPKFDQLPLTNHLKGSFRSFRLNGTCLQSTWWGTERVKPQHCSLFCIPAQQLGEKMVGMFVWWQYP